MTRQVSLRDGYFVVSDDPDEVIAAVLSVSTNNRNRSRVTEALSPEGSGFHLDTVGSVGRARSRDDLPPPWDADPSLDPEADELWLLVREPNPSRGTPSAFLVIRGKELRELVNIASQQRDTTDPP
jgi:hypothetical protein